jgi:ABC-2 type transport system ATP-binding protein
MTEPAIATRALSKRYGSTTAVRSLDVEVPAGVVYGFLGPNGAGKTTTMRMLTGLIEPTEGRGTVAGTDVERRRELIEHVGLLPEEPPLYSELTGREQLQFAADLRGIAWEDVADRAVGICEDLDLAADLDRRIDGYSKGMRRKTAFTQAVMHDPDVAFLDEPTSGLDPRAARTLRELIVDLASGDTTVFLSTHILPVVEEIADRVGVLYDGRLVAEGSPTGLVDRTTEAGADTDADLEDAFLELTSERATA